MAEMERNIPPHLNRNKIHLFQIQAQLITSGVFQDPSFSGRLLKLSSSLIDDLCYTLLIFKCIDFPDAFCVNTVIKGYTCSNHHQIAVSFYAEALRRGDFYPNGFTFPPLISACAKLGCLSLGQMCHGHALKFGVVDHVLPVQNSLLHFYGCCRLVDVAGKVLDEMPVKDLVSWNTVIGGLAKAGEMESAHKMFDEMPRKNVVSWNVMITGYLNFRSPGNALQLFRRMMSRNYESNDTTKVQVIAACARSNRLKEGKSIHGFIIKACTDFSLIIDTNMIDMYSKCGRTDIARKIFDKMPIKNLVSWNAMILGHCIHGDPVDGLSLYSEMADKINPDELTFIGVLCACARLGLLTDGKNYFSEMIDLFHLKPNFAHYWCMANLMANIGRMEEAVSILRNIPTDEDFSPEYSFWAGLLGSCRFQGDATLGEQIAKELIEQDPSNFSHYNLLVNVYALAGKRAEVSRTREMMKERGIKRVACCSLKDLTEIVCDNAKRIKEIGAEC
ncbi:hypothetical protein MIMGU_mgv1a004960mg [Erythranthe guttata]|uniref:Pentatricopeptide repeat-containing protein n=1 Tax=Erythranthe guttata TaxID=4155 RepID=A0A022RIB3_ERYGU|nr:hypothetical protein MIMGU_mgv1a004960mg [Erythranthe guttata]